MYIEKTWSPKGKFNYKIAKNEIISNGIFLKELKKLCSDEKISLEDGKYKILKIFKKIASRYTYNKTFWSFMEYFVRTKVIGNIKILKYNEQELKKLSELSKDNIIVLLPNHKSVFDFMILPYLFTTEAFLFPSILAADVFDIFLIGFIFRKGGVYFIKREEKDPLYLLVFKYYLALLLKYQITNLFFIEGGRNKEGSYSEPKLGVLKYIIDGKIRHKIDKDILFLPISISYEFVPEQEVVTSENVSQKRKHITKSLFKYFSKGKKFESCYLHFSHAIKLSDFSNKYKDTKSLTLNLANKIMKEIKESIIVTKTSLICFTLKKIGKENLQFDEFMKDIERNFDHLKANGRDVGNIEMDKLKEHLELMQSKGIIKFRNDMVEIPPSSKELVKYYSNNIIHFFKN